MHKNPLIRQLALQADRHILRAEEADYLRFDIPATGHLVYTHNAANPTWGSLKQFAATALVIYLGLFSVTNAAAYGKIALASVQNSLQEQAQVAQTLTADPFTSVTSPLSVGTETPAPTVPNPAALLPTPSSPTDRLVIPSLKINVPVVEPTLGLKALEAQDFKTLEDQIHETLLKGVVHYPGTAEPGQKGNAFLTGHSSNVFWEVSPYNTVFALLPKINLGDDLYVTHNQTQYHYRVIEKKEVKPTDVSVLAQGENFHLTLVTCTPVGTAYRRLVVTTELVKD